MTTVRACLPCKNIDVEGYLRHRLRVGLDVRAISIELASKDRMRDMGYKQAPGPTMLDEHMRKHLGKAPVSTSMPSFGSTEMTTVPEPPMMTGDVATVIQRRALEMLERGEMRLTAQHALKAQDMLDRRQEKARDRELMLVLARVLTRDSLPPSKYVGMSEAIESEVIEGKVLEITAHE